MGKIADLFVRLGLKSEDFKKGIADSKQETKGFADAVGKAAGTMISRFASVAGAVALVAKAIGDGVKTIASFERANSTLASVLGTTKDGIKALEKAAIDLGSSTMYSATQVTELQTSLARLGFTQGQILDMQESVLKFAASVGTDLGSAADFAGSALRAFGLDAKDTNDLLDVMAAATSKSALDFSKLQTSISVVAPVAKSFGLDARQTTAFLGALSNAGFDASSASTALRNILLNLADANGNLAKGLGHTAKTFPEIIAALKELNAKGIDLNTTLALTDKRSVAAFSTFLAGADDVAALAGELDNAEGSLDTMYTTMTDNLIGAVEGLKSAWEGLVLTFRDSSGPMTSVVNFLTKAVNAFKDYAQYGTMGKERYEMLEALSEFSESTGGYQVITSTPAPTGGTGGNTGGGGGGIALPDPKQVEKDKEKIKQIQDSLITDTRQKLEHTYRENLALFEKYGKDTTELTRNFTNAIEALAISEAAAEEAEVAAADAAFEAENEGALAAFEAQHGLTDAVDSTTRALVAMGEASAAAAGQAEANFEKMKEAAVAVGDAISAGLVDAMQEFTDQLFGLKEGNAGAVFQALLTPLADLSVKMGEMIMAEGIAIEAAKQGLTDFSGVGPIAAGAALIAIGAAAKSGLAALAKGGTASTSTVSSSTSTTGASAVEAMEIHVIVDGRLKGSDIVLAGQQAQRAWGR